MKITKIERLEGGANVVALSTETGIYETKAGLSHNCDDM